MEELLQTLYHRASLSQGLLVATLIIFRILPIVTTTPFLGGKLVPPETRMGLAVGLTAYSFSYASRYMAGAINLNPLVYLTLMMKELFIGFVLGFVATELFYAMEMGGRMLDVMRGSSMAEVQVPELNLRASMLGELEFQLLLIVFVAINGHGFFIEGLVESFRIVPIDGWPVMRGGLFELTDQIMRYTGSIFTIAFSLVFPGLFAVFMCDVVFGMLNRVAPHLHSYFMAMGVKALAGVAFFFFGLSLFTRQLAVYAEHALIFLRDLVTLMGS